MHAFEWHYYVIYLHVFDIIWYTCFLINLVFFLSIFATKFRMYFEFLSISFWHTGCHFRNSVSITHTYPSGGKVVEQLSRQREVVSPISGPRQTNYVIKWFKMIPCAKHIRIVQDSSFLKPCLRTKIFSFHQWFISLINNPSNKLCFIRMVLNKAYLTQNTVGYSVPIRYTRLYTG